MIAKRIALVLSVVVTFAVVVSSLAAQGNKGKGKGKGDCGVVAEVTFRDSTFSPIDLVHSDGGGPYEGAIGCTGKFLVLFEHDVVYELTDLVGSGTVSVGVVTAGGNLGVEIPVTAQNDQGLLGMDVGSSSATSKVQFNFVFGDTRYFLGFWPDSTFSSLYAGTSNIIVRRLTLNSWEIEASPDDIAGLLSSPKRGKLNLSDEGKYHAPFKLTLVVVAQ